MSIHIGHASAPARLVRGLALFPAAALLALVSGCGSDDAGRSTSGHVVVAHVHGLGINPADGALIVATHNGVFRIATGADQAQPIGEDRHDTMGFTVAGADHFLGSGHPDESSLEAGQPARLGLIESTDAGATWTAISLSGEVDFHALAARHDLVYGWDSGTGRFMVSADRSEWEVRSTLSIFSFAVDPADADHIVAAGPDGLLESNDGGATWETFEGPLLVMLSWDATAGLWGVAPDGDTYRLETSGWVPAGTLPGQPQALLATADELYAAAFDGEQRTGIYRSTDGGETWDLHYRDAGS